MAAKVLLKIVIKYMNWKRTVSLGLVLMSLAVFYFTKIHERKMTVAPAALLSSESSLLQVLPLKEGEEIVWLKVVHPQDKDFTVIFEKSSNREWNIVEPIQSPAESLIVEGMTHLLKLAPRSRELALNSSKLELFGLDKPEITICVKTNQNHQMRCFDFGSIAAVGNGFYVKWKDEDRYFIVNPMFRSVFENSLYTWRKKQVFNLSEKEIELIGLQLNHQDIKIAKEKSSWELKQPITATLGKQVVNDLLTELNSLYAKDFIDEKPKDFASLKLKPPLGTIRIQFVDGSQRSLFIGRPEFARDAYYAQIEGNAILLIAKNKIEKVEQAFLTAAGL